MTPSIHANYIDQHIMRVRELDIFHKINLGNREKSPKLTDGYNPGYNPMSITTVVRKCFDERPLILGTTDQNLQ